MWSPKHSWWFRVVIALSTSLVLLSPRQNLVRCITILVLLNVDLFAAYAFFAWKHNHAPSARRDISECLLEKIG